MKILIITGILQQYRVPILNKIAESNGIKLTVAHSSKPLDDGSFKFKEVILKEKKIGPFTYHKEDLKGFASKFDIVVPTFYLQKISFMKLLFGKRNYKIAYWGIGVKADQNSKFDSPTPLNVLRYFIANKADALLLYSEYAKNKYVKKGVDEKKLFVMNNTVHVNQELVNINQNKELILFIGTLNKSKRIFDLLENYKKAFSKNKSIPQLYIIGKGTDLKEVQEWIQREKLSNKIQTLGAIYDEETKAKYLNKAICAISPMQAGLSVLECMGHGVPFITHEDAITGGERLNIKHLYNGLLMQDLAELENIILDLTNNREKYLKMGKQAHEYYMKNRTSNDMIEGFTQMINHVANK